MSIEYFLRSGVFLILLLSATAHATPVLQFDFARSLNGDVHNVEYGDLTRINAELDRIPIVVSPLLWNQDIATNGAPLTNYSRGIDVFYGVHSTFGSNLPALDMSNLLILDHPLEGLVGVTYVIASGDDENAADKFFAMLSISAEDPPAVEKHSHVFIHGTSSAAAPAIARQSPRDSCLQRRPEQSHKPGGSLCPEEIGSGNSGGRPGSGRGSSRSVSAGGNSAGAGSKTGIIDSSGFGFGSGSGSGGGGSGGTSQGGAGAADADTGSSGADTGSSGAGTGAGIEGNGEADNWFNDANVGGAGGGYGTDDIGGSGVSWNVSQDEDGTIPSEINTVPEPSTSVLLALGLAGIYIRRRSGRERI